MANLSKLQIQAVIDTITKAKEETKESSITLYKEELKDDETYREIMSLVKAQIDVNEKKKALEKEEEANAFRLYNLTKDKTYFQAYEYRAYYLEQVIEVYITKRMEKDGYMLTVDANSLKNELLVSSVDPSFNIANFIDKYSK